MHLRLFLLLWLLGAGVGANPLSSELERIQPGTVKESMQKSPLPTANAAGDYERPTVGRHPFWEVVAEHGLNGRWHPDLTGADLETWPVVRFFPRGTLLTANPGAETQTGFAVFYDKKGKPWLRVISAEPGQPQATCFVRLNREYVRPVQVSDLR